MKVYPTIPIFKSTDRGVYKFDNDVTNGSGVIDWMTFAFLEHYGEFRCFYCRQPDQAVEQTMELMVIW